MRRQEQPLLRTGYVLFCREWSLGPGGGCVLCVTMT